jgi:predicted AlkP superfamily phosphohydrolase/phosphomutase
MASEQEWIAAENRRILSEKAKREYQQSLSEDQQKLEQLKRDAAAQAQEQFMQVTLVFQKRMDVVLKAVEASRMVAEKDRHMYELSQVVREAQVEYELVLEKLQQLFDEVARGNELLPLKRETLLKLNKELDK